MMMTMWWWFMSNSILLSLLSNTFQNYEILNHISTKKTENLVRQYSNIHWQLARGHTRVIVLQMFRQKRKISKGGNGLKKTDCVRNGYCIQLGNMIRRVIWLRKADICSLFFCIKKTSSLITAALYGIYSYFLWQNTIKSEIRRTSSQTGTKKVLLFFFNFYKYHCLGMILNVGKYFAAYNLLFS